MSMTTELAQRMKAAALNATPGRIGDRIDGTGSIKYQCFGNDGSLVLQTDHKNMEYGFIGPNSKADELFFRECSPENVRSLVEALETSHTEREEFRHRLKLEHSCLEDADKRNAELVEALEASKQGAAKWFKAFEKAVSVGARYEERIAELEARTVKLPDEVNVLLNHLEEVIPHEIFERIDVGTWNAVSRLSAVGIQVLEGEQKNG